MAGDKVGTGYVPIKPDTEGFGAELEKGLDKEGTGAAQRSGAKLQKVMKAAFLGGVALLGKSVMDFTGFERGMNEVFTLLPGISGKAMDQMTDQVKDFAVEFGVLPDKVVPALYQSLSAGVPKDNVFQFLEDATKLAKGGATELETAVDGLSSVVNAYGPDVLSAQQASDAMFTTVKLGKTTIDELSGSLFNVTPTAAALGVKFGDVSAALAAMTLQGVPTSVATTQLRQLLVELSKDGSKTADMFKELSGGSFKEFIAGGGNLQNAIEIIGDKAYESGLSISDMFGSVEAGAAAITLTGKGAKTFHDDIVAMGESSGATDEAFKQMNKGLGATMDKLKAKFSVVLLNIGEAIAPTIGVIGEAVGDLLELFSMIPGPLQAVIVLLATATAGLFAFAKPILAGIQLFSKLGGVMSALAANPWIIVLAGLVLIAVLIIKNWTTVKRVVGQIWQGLQLEAKALASVFVKIFEGLGVALKAIWTGYWTFWKNILDGMVAAAKAIWTGITAAAQAVAAAVSAVWSGITAAASAAFNGVVSVATGAFSGIVSFITGIPGAIGSAFATLAGIIAAPFQAAFGAIKAAWNSTVGGFGFTTPDWIPFLGGNSFRIPTMAAGGVLNTPQLFLGGEYPGASRNPEIVTPQNIMRDTVMQAMQQTPAPGRTGPLVHVENLTVRKDSDIEEIARALDRRINREQRAQGRPSLIGVGR